MDEMSIHDLTDIALLSISYVYGLNFYRWSDPKGAFDLGSEVALSKMQSYLGLADWQVFSGSLLI